MTDEQRRVVRSDIFPYWEGKSLEEHFLALLPESTARIAVDTGIIDNDSKWRQAVGEITPDYEGLLFRLGYGGILRQAEEKLAELDYLNEENINKINFYQSIMLSAKAIITLANRYAQQAEKMAEEETG